MTSTSGEEMLSYFPDSLYEIKRYLANHSLEDIYEIRVRLGKPIEIKGFRQDIFLNQMVTHDEMTKIVENLCNHSIYAMQNNINQGFLTMRGGHRVGISGTSVLEKEKVKNIKEISSLNIRIAHEIIGCSRELLEIILSSRNFENTLILSPPGCGKTTLLRDMIRNLSNGIENQLGKTVSLVDERGEIAAVYKGVPQNEIGIRTDVMSYIPKWLGMKTMIRTMAPEILATDEIGDAKDFQAIREAKNLGVKMLLTMHGEEIKDVPQEFIKERIFQNIVVLTKKEKPGLIQKIYQWKEKQYVPSH